MARRLLIDGFNLAFRAYHALPELTASDGTPTGALHGWIKTLWKLEDDWQPDQIVSFFDLEGSDRHLALQPDYKANREAMPEPLRLQIPLIKELSRLCGIAVVEQSGVEADDLIGAAARKLAAAGSAVYVVSADKDLAQLVDDRITQILPAPTANPRLGWRELNADGVRAKFGIDPIQIPDYLALIGDTSDNIPGIAGVGPKTAAKWIQQYGSLEAVISHAADLKPSRFSSVIQEAADRLRINLKMTTLDPTLEAPAIPSNKVELQTLVSFLERMEMKRSADQAWDRYGLLGNVSNAP